MKKYQGRDERNTFHLINEVLFIWFRFYLYNLCWLSRSLVYRGFLVIN